MTKKSILICSVILFALVAVALITASFAWFPSNVSTDSPFTVHADGVILIEFGTDMVITPDEGLVPAVEENSALALGTDVSDVKNTSAGITSVAKPCTYKVPLQIILGQVGGEEEDPEEGGENPEDPEQGGENPEDPEEGGEEPLAEEDPPAEEGTLIKQHVVFGLTGKIKMDNGDSYSIPQAELENMIIYQMQIYGEPIAAFQGYEDADVIDIVLGHAYVVQSSCDLTIDLTVWLSKPQGLLDPALREGELVLYLNVKATSIQ